MHKLIPSGTLRRMLLPPTYGRHMVGSASFTVLSLEVWDTALVVSVQMADGVGAEPRLLLQDHGGTRYKLQQSARVDSRSLQVFTPSIPAGIRSLTVRHAGDPNGRPVVTFAVPVLPAPAAGWPDQADGEPAGVAEDQAPLRRPA